MVAHCQATEVPIPFSIKEPTKIEDIKEVNEPTFLPSMVAHQLPAVAASEETSERPVSMVAHVVATEVMENSKTLFEINQNISMIAHEVTREEIAVDQDIAHHIITRGDGNHKCQSCEIEVEDEDEVEAEAAEVFIPMKVDGEEITTSTENNFILSMGTHQLSPLETPYENFECQVSMVVHGYFLTSTFDEDVHVETDPGMMTSMVSHQVDIADYCTENVIPEESTEDNLETSNSPTYEINAPSLKRECFSLEMLDSEENISGEKDILIAKEDIDVLSSAETIAVIEEVFIPVQIYTEEVNFHVETRFMNSMCNHQLPLLGTPIENHECQVSMVVHVHFLTTSPDEDIIQNNSGIMTSMVSHQLNMIDKSTENIFSEESTEDNCESSQPMDCCMHPNGQQLPPSISDKQENPVDQLDTPEEINQQNSYGKPKLNTAIGIQVLDPTNLRDVFSSTSSSLIEKSSILTIVEGDEEYTDIHQVTIPSQLKPEYNTMDEEHECSEYLIPDISYETHENIKEECVIPTNAVQTSMAKHQLPARNIQTEFSECLISSVAHNCKHQESDARTESCSGYSMVAHHHHTDMADTQHVVVDNEEKETHIDKTNDVSSLATNNEHDDGNNLDFNELVENNKISYTEDNQRYKTKKELPQNNEIIEDCRDKRPVGIENEEILSFQDNFVIAAQINYDDTTIKAYNSKLNRIQELQKLVEDEIGEFENQRKNDHRRNENNVERTETHIVNNVKGLEFNTCMVIHQQLQECEEENDSDDESISSKTESINSVIFSTSERKDQYKKDKNDQNSSVSSVENLIQASCTIENNSPIIITTSKLQQAGEVELEKDQAEESMEKEKRDNINSEQFDDSKKHLIKIPKESSNIDTRMKDTELLNSLCKTNSTQNAAGKEVDNCSTNSKGKPAKTSITLATLNENVRKQTYKIRFKVKLNQNSSQSSILKYLFGCFGGEKLFNQKQ